MGFLFFLTLCYDIYTMKTIIILVVILGSIGGLIAYNNYQSKQPGLYDDLAQCLTKNGVKMYGAYWCPHCQAQKKAFGNSWKFIDYIECALPGGQGQTKECTDAKIEGYPTWVNKDNKRVSGEQSMSALTDFGGCQATSTNLK